MDRRVPDPGFPALFGLVTAAMSGDALRRRGSMVVCRESLIGVDHRSGRADHLVLKALTPAFEALAALPDGAEPSSHRPARR